MSKKRIFGFEEEKYSKLQTVNNTKEKISNLPHELRRKNAYGDRTVLDVRKAEEREVSEQVYKNLQFLNVLYPPSYEFQQCFVQDMFLKPNTKAFPHVMHYLFNILDPNEFRKRFYWPIDKKSENAFRTNTVQYLNYLNDKHNLGWGEIKAFLVVLPGGIKFMKLLLHLIEFIIDEDIKKTEKTLPECLDKNKLVFTQENVEQLVANYETFVNKSVAYKEKLDLMKSMYLDKSKILEEKIRNICKSIGLQPDHINDSFFQMFAFNNFDLFESSIMKKVDEIEENEKYLDDLSNQLDKFFDEKHKFPCDKDLLKTSYQTIQSDFPGRCKDAIMTPNNKIQLSSLFTAFNCIFPSLERALGQCELTKKRLEKYEFEVNEVTRMENEAMQLDSDIYKFENFVEEMKDEVNNLTKSPEPDDSNSTPTQLSTSRNNLKMKCIYTPAVYLQDKKTSNLKTRLALLDDSIDHSFSFANQTTIIPGRSLSKNLTPANRMHMKNIDAMNLLRSITKSCHKKKAGSNMGNLSMLAGKFKENEEEELIDSEKDTLSKTMIESSSSAITPVSHKNKSIYRKDVAIDARRQAIREKFVNHSDIILSPEGVIIQKRPPIEPVRPLDLTTISSSPSGRLDPLVKLDIDLPKILIEDASLGNFDTSESMTMQDITMMEVKSKTNIPDEASRATSDELSEFALDFQKRLGLHSNQESIFNVSDSILKEISD